MPRFMPWSLLLVLFFGCGESFAPKQVDEPCTRTAQCDTGLECSAGVCLPAPDGGTDGGS